MQRLLEKVLSDMELRNNSSVTEKQYDRWTILLSTSLAWLRECWEYYRPEHPER